MYRYYVAAVKSSRGVEVVRFHSHLEQDNRNFSSELVNKIRDFYMNNVSDVEVLVVTEEKFIPKL